MPLKQSSRARLMSLVQEDSSSVRYGVCLFLAIAVQKIEFERLLFPNPTSRWSSRAMSLAPQFARGQARASPGTRGVKGAYRKPRGLFWLAAAPRECRALVLLGKS